ncbi:MAG: hypothetical protein ACNYWU_08475 [Desulfobacterales bacterium]
MQNLKNGNTELVEVPCPAVKAGHLLIQTSVSIVSAGTERMLVEFGKACLIEKASQQPEKVYQVLDKVRSDGLMPTIDAVRNKLGQPLPLGYCNVGKIIEVRGRWSEVRRRMRDEIRRLRPREIGYAFHPEGIKQQLHSIGQAMISKNSKVSKYENGSEKSIPGMWQRKSMLVYSRG